MKVALAAFLMIYFSFFVMTFFALLIDGKNMRLSILERIEVLFVHPIFYMEYIGIVFHAIVGQAPQEWEEIERVDAHV